VSFATLDPIAQMDITRQVVADRRAEAKADARASKIPAQRRTRRPFRIAAHLGSRSHAA
jgi:hypothetical protein